MATGASAAKREAKKQQAQAYYKAFATIKPIDTGVSEIDTRLSRQLRGTDLSAGTKKLARKLDAAGRELKADEGFSGATDKFNKRYNQLKKQLSKQSVSRFRVSDTPVGSLSTAPAAAGVLGTTGSTVPFRGTDANNTGAKGLLDFVNTGTDNTGGDNAGHTFYDTREEALAAAGDTAKNYKAPTSKNPLNALSSTGASPTYTNDQFIVEDKLKGIDVGYRQINDMKTAFDEMNALSENINNSPGSAASQRYATLAEKLRGKLAKESDSGIVTGGQTGLLNSELATASPTTQVIA